MPRRYLIHILAVVFSLSCFACSHTNKTEVSAVAGQVESDNVAIDNEAQTIASEDSSLNASSDKSGNVVDSSNTDNDAIKATDSVYVPDEEADVAAEAQFMALEPEFNQLISYINKEPTKRDLKNIDKYTQNKLMQISNKMTELLPKYQDIVANSNSPKWGLASITRMGMLFHQVSDNLLALPEPPGLPEEVEKAYKETLYELSDQFAMKAIQYYEIIQTRSSELNLKTEFTEEAEQRLEALRKRISDKTSTP